MGNGLIVTQRNEGRGESNKNGGRGEGGGEKRKKTAKDTWQGRIFATHYQMRVGLRDHGGIIIEKRSLQGKIRSSKNAGEKGALTAIE